MGYADGLFFCENAWCQTKKKFATKGKLNSHMGQCNNTKSLQTHRRSGPPVCQHPAAHSNQDDAAMACDNNEYDKDDDCTTDDHGTTCIVQDRTSTAHEPVLDTFGLQAHYRTPDYDNESDEDNDDSESDEDEIEGTPV